MIRALGVLAALALCACTPETVADEAQPSGRQPLSIPDDVTIEGCRAAGGQRDGLAGALCTFAATDAGKTCTDSAECEGRCEATGTGGANGTCSARISPFGCYSEMRDGVARPALCVD